MNYFYVKKEAIEFASDSKPFIHGLNNKSSTLIPDFNQLQDNDEYLNTNISQGSMEKEVINDINTNKSAINDDSQDTITQLLMKYTPIITVSFHMIIKFSSYHLGI